MEEESAQVLPEDMLNEELETLAMASIQTLKQSNKNAEKIKFLNWSTIPLRNKFLQLGFFCHCQKNPS